MHKRMALTDHVLEYRGKPIRSVKNAFMKAKKRAGLDHVRIHDLRHTSAVWMAMAGIDMHKIAMFLGHSSVRVTEKHYARYSPTYLRAEAEVLSMKGSFEPHDPDLGDGQVIDLNGAGEGIRTLDPDLGKVVLYP